MAKTKHSKPEEHFLGQIRELKKENKSLKQKLRMLEKREHLTETTPDEPEEVEPKAVICKECFKGKLEILEIVGKVFGTCKTCGHRIKLK